MGLHIWTAPICVVCLLFALAWACCPFVSGRTSKARPSGGVGLHIWAGWRLRHPCGCCFYFCLFVLLFMAAPIWRDSPVAGLGGLGLACLNGAVLCCRPACLPSLGGLPFCPPRLFLSGLAGVCLSGWGNLPLCLWVCLHVWSSVCIAPASLALIADC